MNIKYMFINYYNGYFLTIDNDILNITHLADKLNTSITNLIEILKQFNYSDCVPLNEDHYAFFYKQEDIQNCVVTLKMFFS